MSKNKFSRKSNKGDNKKESKKSPDEKVSEPELIDNVWLEYKKNVKKIDIGLAAELLVVELANRIKNRKILFDNHRTIMHVIHCRMDHKLKQLDFVNGIDILIIFDSGLALPLQVKFSTKGNKKHLRKYPHIIHFFGVGELPEEQGDATYNNIQCSLVACISNALKIHQS